jgi:V8-like Glu-specific endopeptidase
VAAAALAEVAAIFGEGEPWKAVSNAAAKPHCAVGRMGSGCTGTLITNSLVLTAGHCVFDLFGNNATTPPSPAWRPASDATFEASRNGAAKGAVVSPVLLIVPVGWTETSATRAQTTLPDGSKKWSYAPHYHDIGGVSMSFDYAFVALAASATPTGCAPLSMKSAWAPHGYDEPRELEVIGYPARRGYDGVTMMSDRCTVAAYHSESNVGEHRCDVLPGSSGGPGIFDGTSVACVASTGGDRDLTGASDVEDYSNVCVMISQLQTITAESFIALYP